MKNLLVLILLLSFLYSCNNKSQKKHLRKNVDFEKALQLYGTNNDSAFYYFNKAAISGNDSLTTAKAYNYMASIQSDAGDYFGSQESIMESMTFLDQNKPTDLSCIASNYNELGYTSDNLKNYRMAIEYYDKAINFSTKEEYKQIMTSNKALAYQKVGLYAVSLKMFNQISLKKLHDTAVYARLISNIARTKWLQNPHYNPTSELLEAFQIGQKINNQWIQNLTLSYLADYYSIKAPQTALEYAKGMYRTAVKLNSSDDELEALQKLIRLSPNSTKAYFNIYQKLADSLQIARNAAKNQFAIIRYNTEKSKADNIRLQKENTQKRYEIVKREIILAAALLLFVLTSIIALLWYKKRKQKLAIDAQQAIQDSQLKTSKKVHDVVANGLYRVMSEMENQDHIDKEAILDRIEQLYEKSRDISYEVDIDDGQPFHEKISILLKSFATESTLIAIVGNSPQLWSDIAISTRFELEHILQELMVNMKKHSKATNVVVRFEKAKKQIKISYADNGIGLEQDIKFNNGLKNTGNRITGIGGLITFDREVEHGLKIIITFPIA